MNQNEITTEELHKEIDLVQGCITRMAQNSFMIKGWALGIVSALIALSAERIAIWVLCLISIGVLVMFWVLDAFFLKMEKCYRFKYEWIIEARVLGIRGNLYDLNPYNKATRKEGKKTPSVFAVMFSKPCMLLLFYGVPIFAALLVLGFKFICVV
ncbi:hypothetical protein FACS1894219_02980 [Clostridia bacterium]|nr:hypothetical protein FACS1894219_02980 [Clostridia bacterium]